MRDLEPGQQPQSLGAYLFIYGTLKRGFSRSQVMREQRFAGEARTVSKYRMFDCGSYPGLVEWPEDGISIEGEVWEVDAESLARLDEIEGVQMNLYARRLIQLQSPFDQCPVESYFFQRSINGLHDCGAAWS